jgi:predicted lipid carrier protein YhbT
VKRKFVISVIDGRATVVETPKDKPVMEISFDSNTFVELATGRTPGEQLRDKIEITGDVALGERVANSLNMMI